MRNNTTRYLPLFFHLLNDLHVEVVPVPFKELINNQSTETSAQIRERVMKARAIQEERYKDYPGIHCNAQMTSKLTRQHCQLTDECRRIMEQAMERAVANGVKNLIIQPTHLMHGAEYDEMKEIADKYASDIESII